MTPAAALRSLVYQLWRLPHLSLNQIVQNAVERSAHDRALRLDDLWQLFIAMLCLVKTTYIVIDAIDECVDAMELITRFSKLVSSSNSRVKVLLTVRTPIQQDLCELIEEQAMIKIQSSKTAPDMQIFIEAEIARLNRARALPLPGTIGEIESTLRLGAQGM